MRIYIIEDSEIIKHRIFRLLAAIEDVEIVGSSDNIDEAIIYVNNLQPDAILLDISIGNDNGLNVIKDIKKITPKSQIIMFTNYDFESYKVKSFKYGADYFLDKSHEFQKLPDLLESLKKKDKYIELADVN